MTAYWVSFTDRRSGCIEAPGTIEAKQAADAFGTVTTIERLPYPAVPRLGQTSHTPSFCYQPNRCAGHSTCQASPSCVD